MGGEAAASFMFSLEMRLHVEMFYFTTVTINAPAEIAVKVGKGGILFCASIWDTFFFKRVSLPQRFLLPNSLVARNCDAHITKKTLVKKYDVYFSTSGFFHSPCNFAAG